MSDWWNVGWSFKCDMLGSYLKKYKASKNIIILTEEEYIKLNQKLKL